MSSAESLPSHLISSHIHIPYPAAHASLADTEVTARLAGAVFRLDEAQRRLHALRLAGWASRRTRSVEEDAEPRTSGGCRAEAGDVSWLLFINAGYVSRMVYFLYARVTYFVYFEFL
ncbi:hypothetical protein C8J57DRAFT_1544098 [Mycena rebaudengoi]|nr:hypothetical protein C8J57DRAFT_1544098 [Mycena rebaudengoi]